jgi:iron complex outermembrane receptor protein
MKGISRNHHRQLFLASTAVSAILGFATQAYAADVAPPSAAANSDSSEIVVTAQRRQEKLQNVPITISVVNAEALRKSGANSLSDITRNVAGMRFDTRGGLMQPTIRGVGTPINLAGAGTNVGIYVDGFYNPAPLASDVQLLNVDSIQVLKGPQGTLFGRNTSGGAILINTSQPNGETHARLLISYGSYNAQRAQGYMTAPITDKVAFDLGVLYTKGNGYYTNIAPLDTQFPNKPGDKVGEYRNWAIRGSIKADFTDNFSVTLRYAHASRNDPTPILYQPYLQNGRPLARPALGAVQAILPLKPFQVSADEELSIRGKTDNYQGTAKLDLDWATLTSYTMYRKDTAVQHYSLDYSNLKVTALIYPDDNKTFSQEFILASRSGGKLQYTVGAFYYNNKETYPSVQVSALGAPFFQSAASGATSESFAGFADGTYEVIDHLFLTAGVRYTHDTQKDVYYINSAKIAPPAIPLARVDIPSIHNSKVTPRAVIRYELSSASSVYGSFSQGYKSAILNVGAGPLAVLPGSTLQQTYYIKPETIDAFEVGYKYSTRNLTANISGYYYNYKNQQITSARFVNNVPQSVVTNAASSHIYGIDGDVRYQVTDDFVVNVAASWNHARYKHFPNAPDFAENDGTGGRPNSPGTFTTVFGDASGNHMIRAPDYSATAQATYTFHVGEGRLELTGNLQYTSKIYFDNFGRFVQPGYTLLGLRAEYTDADDRWSVGVAGNNITDKHYLSVVAPNSGGIGSVYGAPATVEGFIRVKI